MGQAKAKGTYEERKAVAEIKAAEKRRLAELAITPEQRQARGKVSQLLACMAMSGMFLGMREQN